MKCHCGFKGDNEDWGYIEISGGGYYGANAVGFMPYPVNNVGSIKIFVCPDCGLLYTDMRGNIKQHS